MTMRSKVAYGLTVYQARYWLLVRDFAVEHMRHPRMRDIRRLARERGWNSGEGMTYALRACVARNYIKAHPGRVFEALDPPHLGVVDAALQETGATRKELFGGYRGRKASRARRLIARRLRKLGIPCTGIAALLNLNDQVVREYGKPELVARRNAERKSYKLAKIAEQAAA